MFVLAWIGGTELVVAVVVALLLFGGRLPEVMKDFGRMYFRLRRSIEELRRETGIDRTLRELEWEARDLANAVPKVDPPRLTPVTPDIPEPAAEAEDAAVEVDGAETEAGETGDSPPPAEHERRP